MCFSRSSCSAFCAWLRGSVRVSAWGCLPSAEKLWKGWEIWDFGGGGGGRKKKAIFRMCLLDTYLLMSLRNMTRSSHCGLLMLLVHPRQLAGEVLIPLCCVTVGSQGEAWISMLIYSAGGSAVTDFADQQSEWR